MLLGTAAYLQVDRTNNSLLSPETAKRIHGNTEPHICCAGSEGVDTTSSGPEKYQAGEDKGSLPPGPGLCWEKPFCKLTARIEVFI